MAHSAEILVVYQDAAAAGALAAQLRERGHKTVIAPGLDEACDIARQGDFDLIIMEVRAVDEASCQRLRTAGSGAWTPFIGLVASGQPSEVRQALEAGCDEYLTTPADDLALEARVRSMLRIKALQDRIASVAPATDQQPPSADNQTRSASHPPGTAPASVGSSATSESPDARWQRLRGLFEAALERSPDERTAFVEHRCGADVALRRELEDLLRSHDQNGTFLETPAIAALSIAEAEPDETISPIPPHTSLGSYRIETLLGSGAMGEVYRARDLRLGRLVAIKVLPVRFASEPDRVRRFETEARAAGSLNHPNILSIYTLGTVSADAPGMEGRHGSPFIVSELLNGTSLRSRMEAKIPQDTAIEWALQALRGLAAAHASGIVHRDLKPDNLFVTDSAQVKILDFGLAKLLRPSEEFAGGAVATAPGMILGTPGYMAPEQLYGEPADHRADIFSFGAILYEMLTATRLLPVETVVAARRAMRQPSWPELAAAPSLSQAQVRIIRRCLAQPPEDRFQSVEEIASQLELRR